jgi:hypothetical protein
MAEIQCLKRQLETEFNAGARGGHRRHTLFLVVNGFKPLM